jgi:NitT/TauT family transport system substrate-binding protein
MLKLLLSSLFLAFTLTSCSQEHKKPPLVISVDQWIGLAPIYYAHSKGWLAQANIQLLVAPSISENLRIFESGASDMFTATQHEYFRERKTHPDLIPVIHYDRSFGGDIVMANRTNKELLLGNEIIDVYIEADTVNEEMLDYWIKDTKISRQRLHIHSRVQDEIATIKSSPNEHPIMLVTYNPHNLSLEKNGFHEIASSKNENYLVIDAMYTSSKLYRDRLQTFQKLNDIRKRAIKAYESNPKKFYEVVKPYLSNPGYDEFLEMKQNIQWVTQTPSPNLSRRLQEIKFPAKDLLL